VILLDVNVVVAAQRDDHPQHATVRPWFDDLVATRQPFGAPAWVWASAVRLTTNRRIFEVPATPEEAFAFVRAVRAQSSYQPIEPGPRHLAIFEAVCTTSNATGDLVPDAFLAAIAIENAATVASFDRDFARFDELEWIIPASP